MKINKKSFSKAVLVGTLSFLTFIPSIGFADNALPAKYDLRTINKVTQVKDQGQGKNHCWAYAAIDSLESGNLIKFNKTEDFSEAHMVTNHSFDLGDNDGGNMYMAAAYLTNGTGPVREKSLTGEFQVENIKFLSPKATPLDNEKIKETVKEYGAVYASFKWDNSFYNSDTYAYMSDSKSKGFSHAVTIVGWDDNYSKNNFNTEAPIGDGAFIVKNQWTSNWGENGYFYVSYYDYNFAKDDLAAFQGSKNKSYDEIYSYDPLGYTAELSMGSSAWFGNAFQAKGNSEILSSIGLYSLSDKNDFEVYLVRDFKNEDSFGEKVKISQGSLSYQGYHTINFAPIELDEREKFAVLVKLTAKDGKARIAVESPDSSYSGKAKSKRGESFISNDGAAWRDLSDTEKNTNVCLKAFTTKKIVNSGNLSFLDIKSLNCTKGNDGSIQATIKNNGTSEEKACLLVGIYDENNKMLNYSYMNNSIEPNGEITLETGLKVPAGDKASKIKAFIWDDSENGKCLLDNKIVININ